MNKFFALIAVGIILFATVTTINTVQDSIAGKVKAVAAKEQKLQRLVRTRFELLQEQAQEFENTHGFGLDKLGTDAVHRDCSVLVIEYRLRKAEEGKLPAYEFIHIKSDIGLILFELLLADELLKKSPGLHDNLPGLRQELNRENPISQDAATKRYSELLLPLHEQDERIKAE